MSLWARRVTRTHLNFLIQPHWSQQIPHHTQALLPRSVTYTRRLTIRHAQLHNFAMYPHHTPSSHVHKVCVFGAGNFGSCLADHLGDSQHEVYIWSRKLSLVKHFNLHHRNPDYLKEHLFSHNIQAIGPELPDKAFIRGMEVLLFAIPTQAVRCVSIRRSALAQYTSVPQRNTRQITTQPR